ncbi:tyrosine-type recombinase/integrase [Virgisporangium aliadipatigenens]|uniref:tyrosine-type recombinase/integrase n=1 Tax=Virgisporangium aliadipatigenens TaxID=741659 RepID=UPI001EF1B7C3
MPTLPDGDPRYGPRALTAAWLAEARSAHTRRAYFRDLADFLAWCQRDGLDPLAARPTDLGRYRAQLPAATAPSTAHRRLSALSSWYRYLHANGAAEGNPVTAVKRPRVDRDASTTAGLSVEEVQKLLRQADMELAPAPPARRHTALRDRAVLRLLADLGLRVGEVTGLDVDALGHNRGYRTLRYTAKGGKLRERALAPHTLEALDEYLRERGDAPGPLFATRPASGVLGRLDPAAVFRLVRRTARAAGIPSADRLSPHSLRHAFATNARDLGIALEDVQDALGHADPRTTRRYDRARHALHREPGLRLGALYTDEP